MYIYAHLVRNQPAEKQLVSFQARPTSVSSYPIARSLLSYTRQEKKKEIEILATPPHTHTHTRAADVTCTLEFAFLPSFAVIQAWARYNKLLWWYTLSTTGLDAFFSSHPAGARHACASPSSTRLRETGVILPFHIRSSRVAFFKKIPAA
jgi:hypothetical protein